SPPSPTRSSRLPMPSLSQPQTSATGTPPLAGATTQTQTTSPPSQQALCGVCSPQAPASHTQTAPSRSLLHPSLPLVLQTLRSKRMTTSHSSPTTLATSRASQASIPTTSPKATPTSTTPTPVPALRS